MGRVVELKLDAWNSDYLRGYLSGKGDMDALRGEMRLNEPMYKHASWRTGGTAQRYYIPADLEDLSDFLQHLPADEPVYIIGLGSNLLVRDGGVSGTVIALHARLNELKLMRRDQAGGAIFAGAGVACAKVARFAARHQLAGAEFLAGIPGTVGGALAMNAGCYGSETWDLVEQVKVIEHSGVIRLRKPVAYEVGYRSVRCAVASTVREKEEWFVGGFFRLENGDEMVSRRTIKQLLTLRVASQPLNMPNAGSVFRNPPGDYAARLIESCGLKGAVIGGAMVSLKHANFIVNTGHASASDIEALIKMVQERVVRETGINLKQEVRIIGEARESGGLT
jgi:UDP-N-acetylmuramate dehydrogenase